ncbi:MAG: TIGR00303 family protein [Desulfurococcales archaeon]|nr:TIGR00303 family protein [Desulfurococcales archaeon]
MSSWEGLKIISGRGLGPVDLFIVVGGSTRTSTIEGISIAGPSPEATLYTPTLDLEYLATGKPVTLPVIPVSPEGLPTPAVVTRSSLSLTRHPILLVDSGLAHRLKVPGVVIPSSRTGGRIDVEPAFEEGVGERIYRESYTLGETLFRGRGVMIGETIPGGTTTAAAVMEALGVEGVDLVSSSSRDNPRELKRRVIGKALERARRCGDVFCIIDSLGDPVHVSISGMAAAALDNGVSVYLAGGTQMGGVLAILDSLGYDTGRVAIVTTRWIVEDGGITVIADRFKAGLVAAWISFSDSPHKGLRMYDEGYVKEGVGAGGAMALALSAGYKPGEVKNAVYREYERLTGSG